MTEHLPRLLAALPPAVDRWFFIRYADPAGAHLRLRFHGDPATLHGELLPGVLDWVEQLRDLRLAGAFIIDGYEPETHRYGGHEALDAAETVFHHDSVAALEQLRLRAIGAVTAPPQLLAAANYLDLARQVHGDRWPDWWLGEPAGRGAPRLLPGRPRGGHRRWPPPRLGPAQPALASTLAALAPGRDRHGVPRRSQRCADSSAAGAQRVSYGARPARRSRTWHPASQSRCRDRRGDPVGLAKAGRHRTGREGVRG
ncbi:hypothetical protein SANTM175S_05676 [Streptomyces antimycoticus]